MSQQYDYEIMEQMEEETRTQDKKMLNQRPPKKSWSDVQRKEEKKSYETRLTKKRKTSEKA